VTVVWTTTPDVIAGRCITVLALLLLVTLGLVERKLSRAPGMRVSGLNGDSRRLVGYS